MIFPRSNVVRESGREEGGRECEGEWRNANGEGGAVEHGSIHQTINFHKILPLEYMRRERGQLQSPQFLAISPTLPVTKEAVLA
jgi:hypothetical protein